MDILLLLYETLGLFGVSVTWKNNPYCSFSPFIYAVRATFGQKRWRNEEKILEDKHFAALTVSSFFACIVVINSLRG